MLLRHFEIRDITNLKKYRYSQKTDMEIFAMINKWNKADCSGRFSEFLSIEHNKEMVGELVISEYNKTSVLISIYIFQPFRNKGYGTYAINTILKTIALSKKYQYAVFIVDSNNMQALNFFNRIGYEQKNEFINPKGMKYYNLKKKIY